MFCPKCGKENPDGVVRCENCHEPMPAPAQQPIQQSPIYQSPFNQQYTQGSMPARPKNYLALNIVFTVLSCCTGFGLVLGIVGIVFATQVNSKYSAGDFNGAEQSAKIARIMFIINLVMFILGIVGWIIYFVLFAVGAASYGLFDHFDMYYLLFRP